MPCRSYQTREVGGKPSTPVGQYPIFGYAEKGARQKRRHLIGDGVGIWPDTSRRDSSNGYAIRGGSAKKHQMAGSLRSGNVLRAGMREGGLLASRKFVAGKKLR